MQLIIIGGVSEIHQHTAFLFNLKTIKVMRTSNRRINRKGLPLNRPQNRTEDLIMYCKLLKYMRKFQNGQNEVMHALYRKVCKNEFLPFIKASPFPWETQWYYVFWYSNTYGHLVRSLDYLNHIRL